MQTWPLGCIPMLTRSMCMDGHKHMHAMDEHVRPLHVHAMELRLHAMGQHTGALHVHAIGKHADPLHVHARASNSCKHAQMDT